MEASHDPLVADFESGRLTSDAGSDSLRLGKIGSNHTFQLT
jgi:hypothetical protein